MEQAFCTDFCSLPTGQMPHEQLHMIVARGYPPLPCLLVSRRLIVNCCPSYKHCLWGGWCILRPRETIRNLHHLMPRPEYVYSLLYPWVVVTFKLEKDLSKSTQNLAIFHQIYHPHTMLVTIISHLVYNQSDKPN